MIPLNAGIQRLKARKANNFGIVPAAVPAISRGTTCPDPKHARRITPDNGEPLLAIHESKTANTGVVHGDEANPNAKPAAIGAKGSGTLLLRKSGFGPLGSCTFIIPKRFSPIRIAMLATKRLKTGDI